MRRPSSVGGAVHEAGVGAHDQLPQDDLVPVARGGLLLLLLLVVVRVAVRLRLVLRSLLGLGLALGALALRFGRLARLSLGRGRARLLELQPERGQHLRQPVRLALEHQHVARAHRPRAARRHQPHAAAHHGDDLRAGGLQRRLDVVQRHAHDLALLRHADLGEVGPGLEALHVPRPVGRHQPPGARHGEGDPRHGHREADRRDVEHPEGARPALGAEARDDQVRRRPDQRGHAAEDGAERERHQDLPRREVEPPGHLHRHRHQERHGPHVVHHPRQRRAQPDQRREADGRPGLSRQQAAAPHVHRAGGLQRPARHQHAGDGDDGGVAEAGEGVLRRDRPGHGAGEQRPERHHVVAPAAPEEHGHGRREDGEDGDLRRRHRSPSAGFSRG